MVDCGANYIRNTISSRDPGNVQPFEQLEFWDRFDYLNRNWYTSPWNPRNNINYTPKESLLAEKAETKIKLESTSRFFYTVPGLDDNRIVLSCQNAFVEKILSCSLLYENVLYCISNEAREPEIAWNHYWARFTRDTAEKAGCTIELTDMYWQPDLLGEKHIRVYGNQELFSFSEVSQNSACNGDENWENPRRLREHLATVVTWPMNSVKLYGSVQKRDSDMMGSVQDAVEKFFRNVLGGGASSRFHRPPSGLGLGDPAKQRIMSARLIEDEVRFWDLRPGKVSKLLKVASVFSPDTVRAEGS